MSIDTCAVCDRWIDTDDDCDCYIEITPREYICLCEPCREKRDQEWDAAAEGNVSVGEAAAEYAWRKSL